MRKRTPVAAAFAALVLAGTALPARAQDQQEVNLYSYRQEYLIRPMLDVFERETGIEVNVVYASDGVLERLKAEGENSPADAILTVDIGRLQAHADAGTLQPIKSPVIEANIPAAYRHPDGLWTGLTARARIVAFAEDRVDPSRIQTYEALGDPDLGYTICTRSGKHVYMQSLTAFMIAVHGEEQAKEWAEGLKSNLARKPQGGDRDQIAAVAAGECDIAITNHYYVAGMMTNDAQQGLFENIGLLFPNQDTTGTHINISGAGLTAHAPNPDNALRLIEFLTSDLAQRMYAEVNYEYPLTPGVHPAALLESWGDFKRADINLAEIAAHSAAASRLMDEVNYDG
jgi:iron(III) transport system substrate-binding protein